MSEINIISKLSEPGDQSIPVVEPTTITSVRVKAPKRILHFSDGTLEEYSDDYDDDETDANKDQQVDVKRLEWGPWMIHRVLHGGNRMLAACDYVGEKIASMLGITTPKYSYEIEQFKKMQEQRAKANDDERSIGGWMQETNEANNDTLVDKKNHNVEHIITSQQNLQKF